MSPTTRCWGYLSPVDTHSFDIDSYFQDRVETTKRTVGQVRKEIEIRTQLNQRFIDEIHSQIRYAQFSLDRVTGWLSGTTLAWMC